MQIRPIHTVAVLAGLALIATGGAAAKNGTTPTMAQSASAKQAAPQSSALFGAAGLIDTAADYLGLTPAQLRERLRGGQTLAQIAVAQGKSVQGLIDTLVAAGKAQLDRAVADGKLTAAQRDQLASQIETRITEMVNRGRSDGTKGGPGGAFFGGGLMDAAADYLGLSQDQLFEQVRGGKTLAQIATAQGKSVQGLIDAMVAAARQHLDQRVAEGNLTAAQRDQIVSQLEARITDLVNNGRPQGAGAPGGFGRPGGSGGPPSGASGAPFFGRP